MTELEFLHVDLVRIVPSENMKRFYGIALQPTLFGEVAVVRSWGRIGTRGRAMAVTYQTAEQAAEACSELECQKHRRGYKTAVSWTGTAESGRSLHSVQMTASDTGPTKKGQKMSSSTY